MLLRLIETMRIWDSHCLHCLQCDAFSSTQSGNQPVEDRAKPCGLGLAIIATLLRQLGGP